MSDRKRKAEPPESAPEEGRESWPVEDAPVAPEELEDRLGNRIEETADAVTQGLRDLQDELLPPLPEEPAAPPLPETPDWAPQEPAGEPLEPVAEPAVPDFVPPAADFVPPAADFVPPAADVVPPVPGRESPKGSGASVREGTDDDRLMAALAWLSMVILQLPIVSVIQLLSDGTKDRPFQRHHAVTSLLFYIVGIAYEAVAGVVFTILTAVTAGCGAVCLWPIFLVPHALGLYYAFQAYSGKRLDLPFLTNFAKQQGWM